MTGDHPESDLPGCPVDVPTLLDQPGVHVWEYRRWDLLPCGSDYSFSMIERTVSGLRPAAAACRRLGMAAITDDHINQICQRDALSLLGLIPEGSRS